MTPSFWRISSFSIFFFDVTTFKLIVVVISYHFFSIYGEVHDVEILK